MEQDFRQRLITFCQDKLRPGSADTIMWIGLVVMQLALIPSLLAVMSGLTDKLPPVDIVLFLWTALGLFFIRAVLLKDIVNIITIGFGFILNAVLMALILFK